jgi:TonB family protein
MCLSTSRSHKHYPESARERGEEGRTVLHFAVDRSGRVIDFAVIKSFGFALDRGALELTGLCSPCQG